MLQKKLNLFSISKILNTIVLQKTRYYMTLDYYRIFFYVARYKSFSKAAEALNNNQPNITRYMNILESELGCKLLIRSHKGVKLTPEGKQLYDHVAVAMAQLTTGENELIRNKSLETGMVSIGVSETALRLYLLPKLEKFHKQYPHVRLRISNHSAPQAVSALEKGLVDFAVITTPVEYKKPLHMTTLYPFKEVLICGRDFNEMAQKRQSLHDLLNIPFISLTDGTATHDSHHQYFFDNHLKFTPDIEAATTDQIIPMVKHNLGIGFCPEELARPVIETGDILQIPLIEHEPEREICLIQDMSRGTSIAVSKLINMLVEN